MPYLGISPVRTDNRKIDVPLLRVGGGSGFNGVATEFYISVDGEPTYPDSELLVTAVLNGETLNPKVDFFIQNNVLTFTTPPPPGALFFAILGDRISLNKPGPDTVTTSTIKDGAVTTSKIADNAITSDKIAPGTVIATDVSDGAITTAKLDGTIGSEAVTTAKIRDLNVTTAKLADSSVSTVKLDGTPGSEAVTTAKIRDLNVTTGKLADTAVTTGKLANDSVDSTKLKSSASVDADRAVSTNHVKDLNITNAKIATDAITADKIASGAVGTSELANFSVTSDKINITVVTDPPSPNDGQLIFNTFSNSPKIYNLSKNRWEEILTQTTSGNLVGWFYLASVPVSLSPLAEKNAQVDTQIVVNDYTFNESVITPKHVLVSNSGKISSSTDINTWVSRSSGTVNNLNTVSWSGTFFFAGGDSNTVTTSADGDNWVSTTGPFLSGSNIVQSFDGNNIQLLGTSLGEIGRSSGGATFTLVSSAIFSSINSFSYSNGVFVVAGSAGEIAYSSDAITWTQSLNLSGSRKVYLQPYGNGFIAVIDNLSNNDVTIKTSTNGQTWTDLIINPNNISTVRSFKYSTSTQAYLITDDQGNTFRSANGKDWSPFNQPVFPLGTSASITSMEYVNFSGVDYFILTGTKTVDATQSPYLAVANFVTTNTQLESNRNYILDTSYGSFSVNLPVNPGVGDIVRLADSANSWGNISATVNANNKSFLVSTGVIDNSLVLDYSGASIDLVWTGTYWRLY